MDECDLEPEEALVRLLVDQLDARDAELAHRISHVRDLVGDVVHPGPSLREKPADGVSSPSGATSSTRPEPIRTAAASTP